MRERERNSESTSTCTVMCVVHHCLYVCMRAQKSDGNRGGCLLGREEQLLMCLCICVYTYLPISVCVCVRMCVCVCASSAIIIRLYIHHAPSQSALAGSGVVTISEG